MTLKSRMEIRSNPDFRMRIASGPLECQVKGEANVKLGLGPVRARLERFPLVVRIPFLKRAHGAVVVGALGPLEATLKPVEVNLRVEEARVKGRLGKDDFHVDIDGMIGCGMEMDLTAEIPAKAFAGALKGALKEQVRDES